MRHKDGQMPRVLHITNIPTPYRIPQLNEMSVQFRDAGWQFHVVFGARAYSRRTWALDMNECRFQYTILNSSNLLAGAPGLQRAVFLYPGLSKAIRNFNPDVVIVTGFSMATIKVWLLSFFRRTKYLIFSGTTQEVRYSRSGWRSHLRRLLARRASGAIAYGARAKAYLKTLGVAEAAISVGINTVDVDFFHFGAAELRSKESSPDDASDFLYVGYLVKRKRVDLLLDVAKELDRRRKEFTLTIVGDGPELRSLSELTGRLALGHRVRFVGYKQKSELPHYYAKATCFLFPTASDIWGLVVNEAMSAGLPCLVSPSAGVAADLVRDGENGWVVDFSQTELVADLLEWILDHPKEVDEMSSRASSFVLREASLKRSAAGFVHAVLRSQYPSDHLWEEESLFHGISKTGR